MLVNKTDIIQSYSDQTGRFPVPSSRGNNYLFILYHQDTNSIHAVAIPNRQAASIRDAWEKTHQMLIRQGHPPYLHILDNECSDDLKKAFLKYRIQFQRVPPKEHRVNAAKRAIHTYKNHFVTILGNCHSQFPLSKWDRLIPQTTITLNLLRSSRIHPSLSAHASLFGNFDFNRTPMAPPGTKIVAHENSETRTSFAQHGTLGWYIGPSMKHYRCWRCYIPDTMQERDVFKVDFFPEKTAFPHFTREAYLRQTAEDMLHLLQPTDSDPLLKPLAFGPPILNAYAEVAKILLRAIRPPSAVPVSTPEIPSLASTAPAPPPPLVESPRAPLPNPVVEPPRVLSPESSVLPDLINQPMATPVPRVPTLRTKSLLKPTTHRTRSTTRIRASPRFKNIYTRMQDSPHLAQSIRHDPTIAGKMFNPTTGHAETIDTLLKGPDRQTWMTSLANEWGRSTRGVSKNRTKANTILGNHSMVIIKRHQVPAGRHASRQSRDLPDSHDDRW
jgi:hypothetical protein